jgi:hypothetical protein
MNISPRLLGSNVLLCIQAALFCILFAVWALPETILIRNICIVAGALIGGYQIYYFRAYLAGKNSISIWLLLALFIWATFHLLFLSNNFSLQHAEYLSIWKRSLLGAIFALGFGLSLANAPSKISKATWVIFYLGLLLPTLIYIFKFTFIYFGRLRGISVPEYFQLYTSGISRFYIAKTAYVGFCIPVLAVALGQLYSQIKEGCWISWANILYLLTIPAVLFVFYAENIKNGLVYALGLTCIFISLIVYKNFKKSPVKIGMLFSLFILTSSLLTKNHIQHNRSWETLFADAKIAVQTDTYQNWQCTPVLGLPKNSLGEPVSVTNYERISWALNAIRLIPQYPLGYGLVERSFGQIGHEKWPNSCLSQSHSGWLDLTLGIGIPGVLLVISALIITVTSLSQLNGLTEKGFQNWVSMLSWALLSLLLIWCTTEISQKVFLEELIFFIALSAGYIAGGIKHNAPPFLH